MEIVEKEMSSASGSVLSLEPSHEQDSNSKSRYTSLGADIGRPGLAVSRMEALMRRVSQTPEQNILVASHAPAAPTASLDSSNDIPVSPMDMNNSSIDHPGGDTDEDAKKARRQKRNFTRQEDDVILDTIRQYGEVAEGWQRASELLVGRTVVTIKSRYKRLKKKNMPGSDTLNMSMDVDEAGTEGEEDAEMPSTTSGRIGNAALPSWAAGFPLSGVTAPTGAPSALSSTTSVSRTTSGTGQGVGGTSSISTQTPTTSSTTSSNVPTQHQANIVTMLKMNAASAAAPAANSSILASNASNLHTSTSTATSTESYPTGVASPSGKRTGKRNSSLMSSSGLPSSSGAPTTAASYVATTPLSTMDDGEEAHGAPQAKRPKTLISSNSDVSGAVSDSHLLASSGGVLMTPTGGGAAAMSSIPTNSSVFQTGRASSRSNSPIYRGRGPLSTYSANASMVGVELMSQPTTPLSPLAAPLPTPTTPVTTLVGGVKMASREGSSLEKVKLSMTVEELQRRIDEAIEEAMSEVKVAYKKREEEWQRRLEEEREKANKLSEEMSSALASQDSHRTQVVDHIVTELRTSLVDSEAMSRQVIREKLAKESARLGYPAFGRNGEEFREGVAGKLLREREKKLEEERARLEANKKKLLKRKNSVSVAVTMSMNASNSANESSMDGLLMGGGASNGSRGGFAVPTLPASAMAMTPEREMEDVLMQEAYVKLKIAGLKGMEQELMKERESLRVETQLHYKELRRFQEEEASPFNAFPLLHERYLMLQLLGRGGFSEVWRAYDLKLFRQVACKIHQLSHNWPAEKKASYLRHAQRECEIHTSLVHPRIVALYDVFEIDENTFCTVMEYCKGGDLDSHLKQHKVLPETEARVLNAQLFDALRYLMSRENDKLKIIHYDLKPGNLLFDSDGNLKIADFGLSKIMDSDADSMDLTSQGAGTYWYLPPECFDPEKPKISSKVDVWSAGVILYQMLFGAKPFGHNISQKHILERNVINHSLKLEFPTTIPASTSASSTSSKKVSDEAKSFIQKCLTPNALQRPNAMELAQHPFLSFLASSSSTTPTASPSKAPRRNTDAQSPAPIRVSSLAGSTTTIGGGTFTLVKK